SSPYASDTAGTRRDSIDDLVELARSTGRTGEWSTRQQLAEAYVLQTVQSQLVDRVVKGIAAEALPATAGALLRLFTGTFAVRRATIGFELAGPDAVAWKPGEDQRSRYGRGYVFRQASCLGGGSTEMQRNII